MQRRISAASLSFCVLSNRAPRARYFHRARPALYHNRYSATALSRDRKLLQITDGFFLVTSANTSTSLSLFCASCSEIKKRQNNTTAAAATHVKSRGFLTLPEAYVIFRGGMHAHTRESVSGLSANFAWVFCLLSITFLGGG